MKKFLSLIIAFLLLPLQIYPAWAQTAAEIECAEETPEYESILEEWSESEEKQQENYQFYFEQSQENYHIYMECLFEYARSVVLQQSRRKQGTFQAEAPNIPFWMTPSSACLSHEKIRETIDATAPNQLLVPALETFDDYRDHLGQMKLFYDQEGGGDSGISEWIEFLNNAELESALLAMDLGFQSINQLRTAFIIHVHLQCLLNNLDKYGRALGEVRRIVDSLPGRLQNASMSR